MPQTGPLDFRDRSSDATAPAAAITRLFGKAAGLFTRRNGEAAKRLLTEDDLVPAGVGFEWWGGATPPTGYLLEDGTTYARATHPDLATVIAPDASSPFYIDPTDFKVPDSRQRFILGASDEVAPSFVAFGTVAKGNEASTLSPGIPAGVAAGDLMLLFLASVTGLEVPAVEPAGWSFLDTSSAPGTNGQVRVYARWYVDGDVAPSLGNIDMSNLTRGMVAAIAAFANPDFSQPLDVAAVASFSTADSTPTVTAGTTLTDKTLDIYALVTSHTAVVTATPPGTLNERLDDGTDPGTAISLAVATKAQTTAGAAGDETFTLSATPSGTVGLFVALRTLQSGQGKTGGKFVSDADVPDHTHTGSVPDSTSTNNVNRTNTGASTANSSHGHSSISVDPAGDLNLSIPVLPSYIAARRIIKT